MSENNYYKQIEKFALLTAEEEKTLITLRYGEDLNNPVSSKLSKEQITKFYGSLIPKIKKLDSEEVVVDMLEAWVEFLRDPESEVVRKLEMTNSEIREAKDTLYKLSRDEKERELYFLREKSIKDEISALANAEEKGIEKGIQQEKIDTVLRLNSIGLDIEQISKGTDIDLEEVKNNEGKCYIAVEDNKAVAVIMGIVGTYDEYDYLDYKCPKTGEITELIVSQKVRSKGVGQQIIKKNCINKK